MPLPDIDDLVIRPGVQARRLAALLERGEGEYGVTLFDLRVVLEIVEHPSEVIHYLVRRGELDKGQFLSGEETDLLGFYLQSGFNLGEAEFSGEHEMRTFGLSDPMVGSRCLKRPPGFASRKAGSAPAPWTTR